MTESAKILLLLLRIHMQASAMAQGRNIMLSIDQATSEELNCNNNLQRLTLQEDFPEGERLPAREVGKPHFVELQGQLCFRACLARGIDLSHSTSLVTQ